MDAAIYSEGLRLSSLGLACHWLRPRTKIPVAKGYQQMPYLPPHVLRSMYSRGFNVGLHTGKVKGATYSVVAVDVDGESGGAFLRAFLPKTPIVSISAKGEHWLYRYPDGVAHIGNRAKIRTKDGTKIDLDIRGDGGNLAIPPSVHPSGVIYQAAQPWTGELLSAMPVFDPEWIPTGPCAGCTAHDGASNRRREKDGASAEAVCEVANLRAGKRSRYGHLEASGIPDPHAGTVGSVGLRRNRAALQPPVPDSLRRAGAVAQSERSSDEAEGAVTIGPLNREHVHCQRYVRQASGLMRRCLEPTKAVVSYGAEIIGVICRVGHVQGIGSHRRVKKCRGCGSSIADRHALGCRTHLDDLEVAWTLANSIARFDRDDDDQLFALQELMELRIIPFLDFGGDHGG